MGFAIWLISYVYASKGQQITLKLYMITLLVAASKLQLHHICLIFFLDFPF